MGRVKSLRDGPRRLRSVPTLPTLFTLGNLACGFAAIHFALRAVYSAGQGQDPMEELALHPHVLDRLVPSFITLACVYVLLGMFCDMLDGLVARVTRRTSDFGGQLDSLADMVTAGVAPAIMVVAIMMRDARPFLGEVPPGPFGPYFLGRLAWVAALSYALGAAIRLARFNVEHKKPEYSHKTFTGLPSPGAAGMVITLAVALDAAGQGSLLHEIVILSLPFISLALALLMVSRIPYARLDRSFLRRRQPFEHLILLMVLLIVFMVAKEATLALLAVGYVLSGPITWLSNRIRHSGGSAAPRSEPPARSSEPPQTRHA